MSDKPLYRVFFNDGNAGSEDYITYDDLLKDVESRLIDIRSAIELSDGESVKFNMRIVKIQYD